MLVEFARRNLKVALECLAWLENWLFISGFTGQAKRGEFGTPGRKLIGPDSSQHRCCNSRPVLLRPKVQKAHWQLGEKVAQNFAIHACRTLDLQFCN